MADEEIQCVGLWIGRGARLVHRTTTLPVVLGSDPSVQVRLTNDDEVLPLHCEIYRLANQLYVRPLTSGRPLWVNYQERRDPVALATHDVIRLGKFLVRVELQGVPAPAATTLERSSEDVATMPVADSSVAPELASSVAAPHTVDDTDFVAPPPDRPSPAHGLISLSLDCEPASRQDVRPSLEAIRLNLPAGRHATPKPVGPAALAALSQQIQRERPGPK